MENNVIKKMLFYVDVKFVSPVSVSSGNVETTDGDVMRDFEGKPFIAGSSLAGAMRSYLQFEKTQQCIFGNAGKTSDGQSPDSGKMSSVYLSDLTFKNPEKLLVVVRDGVGLSDGKTALTEKKFDMEAIDSGAEGSFVMELIVRALDDEKAMVEQIEKILSGISKGLIRLGNKKTRGYGEMELVCVRHQTYTKENILDYKYAYDLEKVYRELEDCKETYVNKAVADNPYICIEVPLQLTGGICIRKYSSKKGEPDMVHMTANGKPVIPGTSFAGAIRSRMKEILCSILQEKGNAEKVSGLLDEMWGYVYGNQARKSYITIGESVIEDAVPFRSVRTGVSRFESAAKSGALREEKIYVGGKFILRINVAKEAEWCIGLLLLIIKDLQNGYLPVGGQTAVGRGIFEPAGQITINKNAVNEEEHFKDFQCKVEEGAKC